MSLQARSGPVLTRVTTVAELPAALDAVRVERDRPVLISTGGAGGMEPRHQRLLEELLRWHVIPLLERCGATVVDGGTDAGLMRAMGRARNAARARLPLVGVAAEGTVDLSDTAPKRVDATSPEPNHTHLVLVPGDTWGDESPWLAEVATAIACGRPVATLVVNGGQITFDDIERSIEQARPIVVLAGSGRTADAIAEAATGHGDSPRARAIATSPLTIVVGMDDEAALIGALREVLTVRKSSRP